MFVSGTGVGGAAADVSVVARTNENGIAVRCVLQALRNRPTGARLSATTGVVSSVRGYVDAPACSACGAGKYESGYKCCRCLARRGADMSISVNVSNGSHCLPHDAGSRLKRLWLYWISKGA